MGLMEAAEGGTLFLDELPSLSPAIQAKLLTAIEDRAIRRVGGNRTLGIDVRMVAATSTDLRAMVAAGKFREDLLQRLDLFRVRLPPLRERGDDLFALAEAMAARIGRNYGLPPSPIPALGRERLRQHPWPGNVRELAHEIERSLVFDQDRLTFASLARTAGVPAPGSAWLNPDFVFPEEGFSLEEAIDEFAARAMRQSGDNLSAAARLLGMPRDFLRYRLKNRGSEKNGK
jgi:two-component system response regulator AtoC